MNTNLGMSRRKALAMTLSAGGLMVAGRISQAAPQPVLGTADLRGGIDAGAQGLRPGASDAQGKKLNSIIARAARDNQPVFLPPGDYNVGNLDLPDGARLHGVAGATRLVYSGA